MGISVGLRPGSRGAAPRGGAPPGGGGACVWVCVCVCVRVLCWVLCLCALGDVRFPCAGLFVGAGAGRCYSS